MNGADILVIFAAGKSTRFGGYPKAFCSIGKKTNIENTIDKAKAFFDDIYVVINVETEESGIASRLDAKIISIVTGQGDADSIRKALNKIKTIRQDAERIFACWGDAVFLSNKPFAEMKNNALKWNTNSPVLVGCSADRKPYAWFDVDNTVIVHSHFRKQEEMPSEEGIHDQSIFVIKIDSTLEYLSEYRKSLGLDVYDEGTYEKSRGEMGFLNFFSWLYINKSSCAANWCYITCNQVKSFNTAEELQALDLCL